MNETSARRDPPPALREAAVLVPVIETPGMERSLVLIRRSRHGRHAGQIAFPGGRIDPGDPTPQAAALREFEEELGVARGDVEVLASLVAMETRTTGFRVHPIIGRLRRLPAWSPDAREVAEVLVIAVAELLRPERRGETVMAFAGWSGPRRIPYIQAGRHRIWGLTYRILEIALPRVTGPPVA